MGSTKKKGKKLIILGAALLVFVAAFLILNPILNKKPEPSETIPVFSFEQTDVDHITWRYNGEVNTFNRADDSYVWAEDPAAEDIDWANVKYMVSAMRFLSAKKTIDLPSKDELGHYGIDPSEEPDVACVLKDGTVNQLWFGDITELDKSYIYAWTGGDTIYIITSYTEPKFQFTIDDLRIKDEEGEGSAAAGA